MPFYQSDDAKNNRPSVDANEAGEAKVVRGFFNMTAALVLNDVIEMVKLPPDHTIVDAILDSDDIDTNGVPTVAFDVGLMSGTPGDVNLARTVGTELFAASNVGQAGTVARPTTRGAFRVVPTGVERSIGIKVQTAPATGTAGGQIGLTVYYRPSRFGA